MQQPGPPPAEMGMTLLGGQGTAPPNVPQGKNDENSCLIYIIIFSLWRIFFLSSPSPKSQSPRSQSQEQKDLKIKTILNFPNTYIYYKYYPQLEF